MGVVGGAAGCYLIQAVKEGLTAKVTIVRDPKERENVRQSWIPEKRVF